MSVRTGSSLIRSRCPLASRAPSFTWALYYALFGIVAGQWMHDQPLLAIVLAIAFAAVMGTVLDAAIRRPLARTHSSPSPRSGRTARWQYVTPVETVAEVIGPWQHSS